MSWIPAPRLHENRLYGHDKLERTCHFSHSHAGRIQGQRQFQSLPVFLSNYLAWITLNSVNQKKQLTEKMSKEFLKVTAIIDSGSANRKLAVAQVIKLANDSKAIVNVSHRHPQLILYEIRKCWENVHWTENSDGIMSVLGYSNEDQQGRADWSISIVPEN
ncbi:MAG: hypothetical protein EA399_06900 [Desulfovibrionales bacterium]|nr:MAG: hypothetical protein EA399_06900 [Desulfovibrionales bacterium]